MSTHELFQKHFGNTAAVDMKHPNMESFFEELNAECLAEDKQKNCNIPPVSGCFYLQSEKTPANSGEYEVITNRGRVIKIKYRIFEDDGIWECEYGKHEINESVVAWRFLK